MPGTNRIRMAIALGLAAASAPITFWLHAQTNDSRALSTLMPSGALLYLEAKDFHSLLTDWDNSAEKKRWITSANYEILSRSRLLGRLSQAQNEFTSLAGIPVAMQLTDQVAGERSAFAFYDFSALRLVYLTQITQSRVEATELWRNRAHYESHDAAGIAFYVKTDPGSNRTIAFANYKEWFLLTTNENLMAHALVLLSGQRGASIATEGWFTSAAHQTQTQGDLRLVYNLTALLRTPQFRTYWIQRNANELKAYSSGSSDLYSRHDGFEEQRVMLRSNETAPETTNESLNDVLAYARNASSLYRAWSMPDSKLLGEVLHQVILGEPAGRALYNPPAPIVSAEAGAVGSEAELETRIDEPPFQPASEQSVTPLVNAITAMQPTALLHVQASTILRDQVFVMPDSGAVIICKQPERAALDRAMAQVSNLMQTGTLDALRVSIEGNAIILTRMDLARGAPNGAVANDATYVAVYSHSAEWPHYRKLFEILDRTAANPEMTVSANTPAFFSGNLQSIGESLSRLRRISITTADRGALLRETVRYEWAQQ